MYKTSMKHLWMHEFPFRNVIFLAIECKMYPKIQQKLRCVTVWLHFKTDHALLPLWRKQGWILWRTISWWKASAPFPYKKKTELSFELSLSIFCLLTVYFNLEMQNSGLKTTAWCGRGLYLWKCLSSESFLKVMTERVLADLCTIVGEPAGNFYVHWGRTLT